MGVSGVLIQHQSHQWLMLGSSFSHPTTTASPRRPSLLPTELMPIWCLWCPSPLLRDVGPSPSRSMEENAKGWRTRGGTREVGGPSSASQKQATTVVGTCSCPFLIPRRRWLPHLTSMATWIATKGPTTTQWTERRHHKPVDNMASQSTRQSTTQQVNRRHGGPIDHPAG